MYPAHKKFGTIFFITIITVGGVFKSAQAVGTFPAVLAKAETEITSISTSLTACQPGALEKILAEDAVPTDIISNLGLDPSSGIAATVVDETAQKLKDSKTVAQDTKDILLACKNFAAQVAAAQGLLTTASTAYTNELAVGVPILGSDGVYINMAEAAVAHLRDQVAVISAQVSAALQTRIARKNQEQNQKSRQFIQFDQILNKITERMKLALVEMIKSKILETIQGSGAPQWVTNWATRYADKFFARYIQVENQLISRYRSARSGADFSTLPNLLAAIQTDPISAIPGLRRAAEKGLNTMPDLIQVAPGLVGTGYVGVIPEMATLTFSGVAGNKAQQEAELDKEKIASAGGFDGKGHCEPIRGGGSPSTVPGGGDNLNTGPGGGFPFNNASQFASNKQLLQPMTLNRVAVGPQGATLNQRAGGAVGSPGTFDPSGGSVARDIPLPPGSCPEGETWVEDTPGVAFEQMTRELLGIDIKQMLNNTIENWVDKFLDDNIISKLNGSGRSSGGGGGSFTPSLANLGTGGGSSGVASSVIDCNQFLEGSARENCLIAAGLHGQGESVTQEQINDILTSTDAAGNTFVAQLASSTAALKLISTNLASSSARYAELSRTCASQRNTISQKTKEIETLQNEIEPLIDTFEAAQEQIAAGPIESPTIDILMTYQSYLSDVQAKLATARESLSLYTSRSEIVASDVGTIETACNTQIAL